MNDGDVIVKGKLFIKGIRTEGWGDFPIVLVDTGSGEITRGNSDLRLKEDVVAISDVLSRFIALRGVTYRWNEEGLDLKTKGISD